ncbi:hypothetical protein [Aeromonas jandaei]|uniref:hypothetical protein n=1 Tax=Aeromonas jandaei TaxID=650 RepID=UPI001ADDBFFC|nr:hypothetical protein [Aeromonas jandaei]QTL95167.1 hypothetical protein AjGTCBM29_03074 [Aeromonas jandaei]
MVGNALIYNLLFMIVIINIVALYGNQFSEFKMSNKKIIFVVGHENWGKSKTLKALTDNNRYVKNYELGGLSWFIRRMSNDDQPAGYYKFMDKFTNPNLIAAFCPNFDDERNEITINLLKKLSNKGYEIYFWVLKIQFTSGVSMSSNYIDKLKDFGEVEVYSKNSESSIRATELRKYIEKIASPST